MDTPTVPRGLTFDPETVETPAFVCELPKLDRNLAILDRVQRQSGAKILVALKGFALWGSFGRIKQVLPGVTSSSVHEARLGREEFGGEVHACCVAYSEPDFREILTLCDHVVFNSVSQLQRFKPVAQAEAPHVELGLRINPEHSEVKVRLYDPCAPGSRLGVTRGALRPEALEGVSGLHFHSLCELGSDALERTLATVEAKFGEFIPQMKWLNFGGGHHITRPDYDVDKLIGIVKRVQDKYGVQVYLEPGEAIGLNTGVLVASVLDIVHNEVDIAILDTSATAHMPDTLEMPYRPVILGAGDPGEHPHLYRLGGLTCLAGDVIGDWSFPRKLEVGDRIVFMDMIHYTMVKTTTFNGVRLPSIALANADGSVRVVRRFGYEDYRDRLS